MICEHCSCNQDDLFIFNLPCGYLVCYEHINSQDNFFECFVCKDHQIDKDSCLHIKKNEKKLNQIIYNEKRKSILNLCDHVDSIKQDIGSYLKDCLSSVNSKIDLKRETLKVHFTKIIDDYYESLRSQVQEHESKYADTIKKDLNQIDTKKIRDEIQNPNQIDPNDFNTLNEFLTYLKAKNLDQNLQQMEKFQNFNFYQSEKEPDLDISELFGSFSQNDTQMENDKSKSYDPDQPKVICKVGLAKFEELSNGQIVSTSFSKPSNFVIYDPRSGRIKEIAGNNSIEFLFTKEDSNEIITIDNEFNVRIFLSFLPKFPLNHYKLIKKSVRLVDLVGDKIFILNDDFFLTILNYYNGQIINHFLLEKNPFFNYERVLFFNCFIIYPFCDFNQNHIFRKFNFDTGKIEGEAKFEWNLSGMLLEKLDSNISYITNSSTMGELIIWDTNLNVIVKKVCHSSYDITVIPCKNGFITDFKRTKGDGEIKVWNALNLNLVKRFMMKDPLYAKILKSGKLVCIDKEYNSHLIGNYFI